MDNYLLDGEMYQYNLGWLIKRLKSLETDLNTAIDLKTIHYADPIQWDITTQYSPNTVVVDPKTGTAYMSKTPVPAGILLTNTKYWVVVFNYQQIYENIKDGVASNERSNEYASHDYAVNDLVWWGNNLYRVLKPITSGGQFKPDDNVTRTTIEDMLTHLRADNYVADVNGDYTVNAGDIAMTAANATMHTTKDRTIDTDGNDSVHIDGASTLNVGGLRTETFAGDKTEVVTGTSTEKAGNRNTTVTGKWAVNLPSKTFDMKDVALQEDISSLDSKLMYMGKTVKSYGATGDGVTDDSDAIMAMINNVGYAFFTKGTYRCNITLPTGAALIGASRNNCILKGADATASVITTGNFNRITSLTITGGLNGIYSEQKTGLLINDCTVVNNIAAGVSIDGKREEWSELNYLTSIVNSDFFNNGADGIKINSYPDFKIANCECYNNTHTDNTNANIHILNCTGKIINSHCWNKNDGAGFKRTRVSLNLENCAELEVTNCHIEGGRNSNISCTGTNSSPTFINCYIYASFGASGAWLATPATFIGCKLSGQAADDVTKPAWIAFFNNDGTADIEGLVLSNCIVTTQLFANNRYTRADIDIRSTLKSGEMKNIAQSSCYRAYESDGQCNVNSGTVGGGATLNCSYASMYWLTGNVTLTGKPYAGMRLHFYNSTASEVTVTVNIAGYSGTFKMAAYESVDKIFTNDSLI